MNQTRKFLGWAALGLAIALASAHGQTTVAAPAAQHPSADLLGKNYGSLDFSIERFRSSSSYFPTGWGPTIGVNVPVHPNVDLGFDYAYERGSNSQLKLTDNAIDANVTAYTHLSGFSPFVTAALGYDWNKNTDLTQVPSVDTKNNQAFYNLGAGVEVPVTQSVDLRGIISYTNTFKSPHPSYWSGEINGNYWVTADWGLFAGVTYNDSGKNSAGSFVYTVGFRSSF